MDIHPTPPALPLLHEIGQDLLHPKPLKRAWILGRPFLFLFLYVLVGYLWNPWAAIPFLIALFIANICAAHDVVHNALQLGKPQTHSLLSLYGILVMQSGHAFRVTHLSHHAMFPSKEDPEGAASYKTAWQSLLMGPTYVPKLWYWAFNRMKRQRNERVWMIVEAMLAIGVYSAAILLIPITLAPIIYVVVMTLGSWLYPIVTAYFPHHHAGEDAIHQARSMHGKVLPWLLLGLNYHLEHHLYPRVPSTNLGTLSKRLLPYLEAHDAEVIQVP